MLQLFLEHSSFSSLVLILQEFHLYIWPSHSIGCTRVFLLFRVVCVFIGIVRLSQSPLGSF